MPAWLIPALKAVLPHVGTIVSVAAPAFTKMRGGAAENPATMQQQIAELQTAASQNAANIRELAAQLQATVKALELAAAVAEARQRRLLLLGIGALSLSALALALVLLQVYTA